MDLAPLRPPPQEARFVLRRARVADAPAIAALINHFAAQGLMLPKRLVQLYEGLREFVVAEDQAGQLIGCGALRLMWHDLAEVRSLAVAESAQGWGVGRAMVEALIEDGRAMGLARIFALTYQELFFARLGFDRCEKDIFPQKVWADCRACPKRAACDEIAMLYLLDPVRAAQSNAEARALNADLDLHALPLIALDQIEQRD